MGWGGERSQYVSVCLSVSQYVSVISDWHFKPRAFKFQFLLSTNAHPIHVAVNPNRDWTNDDSIHMISLRFKSVSRANFPINDVQEQIWLKSSTKSGDRDICRRTVENRSKMASQSILFYILIAVANGRSSPNSCYPMWRSKIIKLVYYPTHFTNHDLCLIYLVNRFGLYTNGGHMEISEKNGGYHRIIQIRLF